MKGIFTNTIKTDEDRRQIRIFLLLDLLYVSLVFLWTIFLPLSGSDYLWFHDTFFNQPMQGTDLAILSLIFSYSSILFRIVNFILLYILMVFLFFITRFLTAGPWWLGSLSAVLFMSHPLTGPHVVQINGYETLLPILINALPLLFFAHSIYTQTSRFIFVWLLSLFALLTYPSSAPFVTIIGFGLLLQNEIQGLIPKQNVFMFLLTLFPSLYFLKFYQPPNSFSLDFLLQFSLLIYPLGWLPMTQTLYHWQNILPILYGLTGILILVFISWKIKQKYLILFLWGTIFLSMFSYQNPINLSQPLQNSCALFPLFLFCIVVSGIGGMIQRQPRWKTSIVKITTLLCIVMMSSQIFLNGLYAYSSSREQQIAEALLTEAQKNNINEFILFPASIEYRWHKLNIFPALLKKQLTFDSSTPQITVFPYCKFYPDYNPDAELIVYRFSENALVIGITPTFVEYRHTYPSEFMILDKRDTRRYLNPKNNTCVEFLKEEQTENVVIRAEDKKLSKNLFLWDNREKTYKLITFK